MDADFARKVKDMKDRFKESVKKMDDDYNKSVQEIEDRFENIRNRHNKAGDIINGSLKNMAENLKSSDIFSVEIDKKLIDIDKTLNSMLNDSLSNNLYEYDSLNESTLGIASIVSGLATILFAMVDGLLRTKDARDINENIKYLKMIKRKLTKDITKIKNHQKSTSKRQV